MTSATPPFGLTSSQTVGPFFRLGFQDRYQTDLAGPGSGPPHVVLVTGRVLDGGRRPVPDAVVEIWQADEGGRYPHAEEDGGSPARPGFTGFGRCPTDAAGAFRFRTVKPGPVPFPDGRAQAPHLSVSVFMRGLLDRLVTRVYFGDDERNQADPVLGLVDGPRRRTLLAQPDAREPGVYRWDVVLRGAEETVFFDF